MDFWVTDVVTSWRHVMTSQNLNYLSQLRDVLESWFFFVSMDFLVNDFKNIIKFLIVWCHDVMTSFHSVTKPDLLISQVRDVLKSWFFYFQWIFGQRVQKCCQYYLNFNCLMSWCHDVMLWRHVMTSQNLIYHLPISACGCPRKLILFFDSMVCPGSISSKMLLIIYLFEVVTSRCHVMTSQTLMYLSQHADVLERWFLFVSIIFWVSEFENVIEFYVFNVVTSWRHITTSQNLIYLSQLVDVLEKWLFLLFPCFLGYTEFKTVNDFLFILMSSCHDVMSWRHKVCFKISRLVDGLERWFFFMIPWFNWLLILRMLSFMYYLWWHVITSRA